MAGRVVIFALALSICKVQSQSIGCCSPSSNINGLKASPQLQLAPGQGCNLQAIPLSQFFSQSQGCQGSNLQKAQAAISVPKQSIQVSTIPQISSCAQYAQPSSGVYGQPSGGQSCQPSTQVISAPVSTITIPPAACTTIIDNSLSNSLANALQMMIANDFINSAISNNIINQDGISIPVVETSVPSYDLSAFIRNLNANQLSGCEYQTTVSEPEVPRDGYDWEQLLSYLNGDKKKPEPEPDNKLDTFFKFLKQKGQSADQITKPCEPCITPSVQSTCDEGNILQGIAGYLCGSNFLKQKGQTADQITKPCEPYITPSVQPKYDEDNILQAIAAYLSGSNGDTSSRSGNLAEVVFPEEIPAQLICNYGYMPTTVPVVSFSVQPVGDTNCNYIVGSQAC